MSHDKLGLQTTPHEGQEIYQVVDGIKYARYPIKTRLALIDEDLNAFIREHIGDNYREGDIFCIASKVISICKGYYVKESSLKVGWLAKNLVRFVKKWPNDAGFAVPAKIQLAMDIVGMPRFLFAMFVGGFMKLLGQPGWFYRIAGHNINSIDGFIPEQYPEPLRGYGFLAPENADRDSDEIEEEFGFHTAILDGNNVENIVLGMSKGLKARISKEKLLEIIEGNPQGQSGNTPMLIVRAEE